MKPYFYLACLLFLASCSRLNGQCQTFDYGSFKVKTPKGWKKFKTHGNGSVEGFTNGKDSLFFDYGMYSPEIDGFESTKHLYAQDTINGFIAVLQIPKVDGNGSVKVSFPRVNENEKFSLVGNNIKGTEKILQIFKSVTFRASDTTRNGTLTLEKFKPYGNENGRTIFINNCASCHLKNKDFVGPALTQDLLNSRTNDWFYTFFKDRRNMVQDSAYLTRKKKFTSIECAELPDLPKQNLDQLISYLKGK